MTEDLGILGKPSDSKEFLDIPELGGKLYLTKTILFYDVPLIFICLNDKNEIFLFNEKDDEKEYTEWFVIRPAEESLIKFFKQEMSFRDFYRENINTYFTVRFIYEKESTSVDFKNSSDWVFEFYDDDRTLFYNVYDSIGETQY